MRKKVLVLGGTGFIGSALLKELYRMSDQYDVALLAHRNIPYRQLEHLNLYVGHLGSFDLGIIDRFRPDYIVHMARIRGKGRLGRWLSAQKGARANQRIIKHLEKYHPETHVIYVSGTLVYGDRGEDPIDESADHRPTAFAREYVLAEMPWVHAQKAGRLPISMLMPPWIIGDSSWFRYFYIEHMRREKAIPQFGNGENWMSLLDIEDCAGLIAMALNQAVPGRNYNLFAPDAHIRLRDFVKGISEITGLPIRSYTRKETIRTFDRTVYEAFSFSLKSVTTNPELLEAYTFRYPDLPDMITKNITRADRSLLTAKL